MEAFWSSKVHRRRARSTGEPHDLMFIAVVGGYGVVSYAAGQRTREVGIRIALGATSAQMLKLILSQDCA